MNENDFSYEMTNLGFSIKRYLGIDEQVVIPETYGRRNVDCIGTSAFENKRDIKRVKLPNFVIKIGKHAFKDCDHLEEIELPYSLQKIEAEAFVGCSSLKSITLPDSLKIIGPQAFSGCSALTRVKLPESIESCGGRLFEGCSKLSEIIIPKSFKVLGNALAGCTGFSSFSLPNSVKKIGAEAFIDCSELREIIIPESVEQIALSTFNNCKGLECIELPPGIKVDGSNLPAIMQALIPGTIQALPFCFAGCESLKKVTVRFPENFKSCGDIDFKKFDIADELIISGHLSHVTKSMLSGLRKVKQIVIVAEVDKIEAMAFSDSIYLESITIPASTDFVSADAFEGCTMLREIRIDTQNEHYEASSVFLIEKKSKTLMRCLPSVSGELVVPEAITCIGPSAFVGRDLLTSVVVPGSVVSIAGNAFAGFRFSVHETLNASRRFELCSENKINRPSRIRVEDEAQTGLADLIAANLDD